MSAAYYSSNYNESTTTTGNSTPSSYWGTVTISNCPEAVEPPMFPVSFNGCFWEWLYGQVYRKAMSKKKREKIRNRAAWSQRTMTRNREYRSRPVESEANNE